ncbi:hypothetical protein C1Y40_01063 [Mycobacterium talmoniae]|uniref:Uncharacterized protein n=1 Tax=Mycobacterium talmoniae TaxID=1858794 RepID=A0A2S8BPU5_9MYCO|nr:hypothetical protein C1Y40_01063 [Mycobacterium talmoniae]
MIGAPISACSPNHSPPNIQAIASALGNVDSSRILTNLLAATPPDGAIELHVTLPQTGQPPPEAGE